MKRARANGQHPRTLIVATANAAIAAAIMQVEEKYDLTHYELTKCLADYLGLSMKYALRVERHGKAWTVSPGARLRAAMAGRAVRDVAA